MLPAAVKTLLKRSKSTTPIGETLVITFLGVLAAYGGVEVFAAVLVWHGVEFVDSEAQGSGIGFRLLILPGVAAFWPLFLYRRKRESSKLPSKPIRIVNEQPVDSAGPNRASPHTGRAGADTARDHDNRAGSANPRSFIVVTKRGQLSCIHNFDAFHSRNPSLRLLCHKL